MINTQCYYFHFVVNYYFIEKLNLEKFIVNLYLSSFLLFLLFLIGNWKWPSLRSSSNNSRNSSGDVTEDPIQHIWGKSCMLCRRPCCSSCSRQGESPVPLHCCWSTPSQPIEQSPTEIREYASIKNYENM